MAGDVSKRQNRIKETGRATGCRHEEIFNVIHTLAHSHAPVLEHWPLGEHTSYRNLHPPGHLCDFPGLSRLAVPQS